MRAHFLAYLLSAISLIPSVYAGFLHEGSYEGLQNGKDEALLLLKAAPGRQGSLLGLLIKDEKRVSLYLIDEINQNSYAMTPLEVTQDGELGMVNDDPSLVITSSKDKNGKDLFKIMSANSSNQAGFGGYLEFNGKSSSTTWLDFAEGTYSNNDNKNALTISAIDTYEREATAVFLTRQLSGTFTVREKFPSMYLLNKNSVLATGVNKDQTPSAILIFIKTKNFFRTEKIKAILVNPKNDTDISIFNEI